MQTHGMVSFRPLDQLAKRIEIMRRLRLNQSAVLNETLTSHLDEIDPQIEREKSKLRAALESH